MTTKAAKLNNRGFSLVELLVGVAILIIVSGPLLYSFVVSQRISRNSHELGEATIASRNIIETIRSEGVSRILNDVDSWTAGTDSPFGTGTIISYTDFDLSDPTKFDANGVYIDGEYTFHIENIAGGTRALSGTPSGATMLDAVVTIDAKGYRAGGTSAPFNELEITEYLPIDAPFNQPRNPAEDPDVIAAGQFATELMIRGVPAADAPSVAKERMKRTITVDVVVNTGSDTVTVDIIYEYELTYGGELITIPAFYDNIYWDHYDPDDPTLSVYVFYRPHYNKDMTGIKRDDIWINNLGMLDLSVFLIKQLPVDSSGNTITDPMSIATDEAMYTSQITQKEHASRSSSGPLTMIYTNFNMDLSTGTYVDNLARFPRRITYGEHGIMFSYLSSYESDLVSRTTRDRMYDITVTIYNSGEIATGEPLSIEFDATHLD